MICYIMAIFILDTREGEEQEEVPLLDRDRGKCDFHIYYYNFINNFILNLETI